MRSGAAVMTPADAAIATTIAKHDIVVNVTTPQPDKRIANTAITAAAIAASSTLGTPGAPGTARKPAAVANTVAITLSEPGDRVTMRPMPEDGKQQSNEGG
jgi:hypothetical protein